MPDVVASSACPIVGSKADASMRLPGVHAAHVDPAKVRDYLLSHTHPLGRHKAAFFAEMGYSASDWECLAADLRRHAAEHPAVSVRLSRYGRSFEVRGSMRGPSGSAALVTTVWIVLRGEDHPRFVTAYPRART